MFKRKETRAFLYSICLFCIVIFICRFSAVNIKADDTIGRAEWLHRLTETFVMTVDEDNYPDNYFSDLDSGSEYYRDVMVAVEFGVVDIEAGEAVEPEKPVTREFAAHTLNYCLGYQLEGEPENKHYTFSDASQCQFPDDAQISVDHEWLSLVNGKFLPEQNVTAAEVENMLSGAANIIKTTIIDENADSNYVFAENVVVFPKGTDVSINENDVVTVSSAKAIREGDTFVVYPADLPCLFRARSVESNGDGNMVITTEEADEESAVVSIDSEGIADVDLSQFESAENVNAEYIRTAAQARDASQAYGIEVGKDSVVADTSISLGNGAKVKLAMNLSGLRLSHDIKTLRRYYYVSLEGNMNATGTLVSDAAKMALASKSVTLGSVRVAGVGKISITAEITAEGKIIVQYNGGFQTGFQSEQGKFRLLCKFHKKNFSSSVEAEASIALKASAGIDLIVVKGSLYMQAGINAKMTSDDYNDGKAPRNCTHIAAWLSADGGAKVTVGIGLLKKDLFNKHTDIFVYKNSPVRLAYHFEDRISVSACTRGKDYKYFTDALSRYGSCSYGDASSSETGADGKPYTIYTYTLDEDENATITGYRGNVSVLSIPETLDGYQVTAIGKDAFKKNTLLGVITIPNAVISIGSAAFAECSNLSYVVLPKGLQAMGAFAFYNCDQLTEIEIPKSLKETTNDYYPDYHYGYVDGPFYGCDGLKKIVFEEGTTKVANGLFAYCLGIEEITIPDTVTMIGNNAFGDCVSLRTVRFGTGVTEIDKNAFIRDKQIAEITMTDSITKVASGVFAECEGLNKVTLSKALQTMGAFAFYNCDQLTEIEIPKSLKETTNDYYPDYHYGYVDGPFYGCDGLKKIIFEEGVAKVANGLFAYCPGIEEITIPDTVTMIGNNAFGDCVSLRTVRFGTGVTEIDKNAFIRDKQIAEITMTDSITKVASGVFAECEGLNKVTLSKALQTMGAFAFYNCDQLTEIEIPKSLKETTNDYYPGYHYGYVNGPFYGCDGLKNVTFETGTLKVANGLFAYCTGIENITIPDTVEQVENVAFYSCTLLKKVSMADSVKALGSSVFNGCSSLSEINLSKQITHIPNEAFRECAALETVVIPEGVTRIGDHAFRNAGVKAIELPTAMEWIGESAFEGAHVEQVIIKDAPANIRKSAFRNCASLSKVELGKKVKEIGEYVFDNCDAMTDISLPDSVSVLGRNTFSASELLKNVSLGNGITKIPERAFYECPSLESIVLPYRVNTIDNEAFVNCTSLKELTIPRKTTQIADTILSYPAQMTIYGVAGTYAEDYAGSKNMKFVGREIPAEEVVLSPAELTLNNGSTGALELSIVPNNFTDEVVWRSTNEDVATVTDTGIVEAKGIGTAAVNVTVGGLSAVCNVTVMQPVTAIYLSEDSLTMNALETHTLTADVSPETADNKAIEWSSSDEKVVTVDQNGLLTAVAKGTAAITAKALDGSGKEGSCSVTVRNNAYVVQSPSELESEHNYSNGCSDFWIYTLAGAESLDVTFHENTNIEEGFDYLYIYTGDGTEVGKYTGTALAGQTVTVAGDTVRIQLVSDDAGNAWGFKVAQIRNSSGEQIKIPQKITGTDIYTKSTEESQFKLDAVLVEGDGVLSYASDNEDVAAVSEDGTITIKGAGTAVITVTSSETELYQEAIKEIMLIVSSPDDHLHVLGQPEFVWTNDTASASLTCTECNMSVTLKTQVETNRIEPTCTQEGILSYMASVTVDGNVYSDKKEEIIPASGHTGGTADCGTQAVCDACSQMYGELNPENHTGDTEIRDAIDASCITVGYSGDVYCTKCGRIIASGTELPVTGHQFGSWTVVKAATYTAFGEEERSCSVCAEKETRTIEKLVRRSIRVKSIKITGIASKIAAGKKIKLTASVSPANASNKKITWKTSNIKVASVNANGVVTLKKNSGGKRVTITATAKDGSKVTARYTIISMKGSVKAVKISGKKTVKAGKTLKLKGKVTASKGANKKLKWSSSNKKYATVSSSGKVKALKAGKRKKVKITAAAMDGSGKKSSITIKIK